jgi:subtilisin family serine protease
MDVAKAQRAVLAIGVSLWLGGCANILNPQSVNHASAGCSASAVPNQYVVRWKDGHTSVEKSAGGSSFQNIFLREHANEIDSFENDHKVHINARGGMARGGMTVHTNVAETSDWGQQIVQAQAVWSQGALGQGVTIAIVDSGIDPTHPLLQNQLYVNPSETFNGIDDDNNGYVDDVSGYDWVANSGHLTDLSGHGTHVSGIIGAAHASGAAVQGIAPSAKILPLRFIVNEDGDVGKAIIAMDYAAAQGARVISASWGGLAQCMPSLKQKIAEMNSRGILTVFAAGNAGVKIDSSPEYPAAFGLSGMITVGASTSQDLMASYSNFSQSLVELMAPGNNIYSTVPAQIQDATSGQWQSTGSYMWMSGTSMATPFVSGAAAVLWSLRPRATLGQIKSAILNSVDQGDFVVASHGRLNLLKAANAISQLPP